ncbi:MAG: hypothetical protein LBL26_14745 [Peptococcaceae bacterium]|nr:hypothetical protein [Peptococcaceae bacterium]
MDRLYLDQYLTAQQKYDDFLQKFGTGTSEGAPRPGNVSKENVSEADREAFDEIAERRNKTREALQEKFAGTLQDNISDATSPDRAVSNMTAARLYEILTERQTLEDPLTIMADQESRQKIARQFRAFTPVEFQREPLAQDALEQCEKDTLTEINKHEKPKRMIKALTLMVPTKEQAAQMAKDLEARSKAAREALTEDLGNCRFASFDNGSLTVDKAKNMRGELAGLRERAATALLPEDQAQFEKTVREKTEPYVNSFLDTLIPKPAEGEPGFSDAEAQNLRNLAAATDFNSRVFGAIAKLPPQQRKEFAAGLSAGPGELDGMMKQIDGAFSAPSMSDDALDLKLMLHEGRLSGSPRALSDEEHVKIAANHGLGRAMGKLREAARKTAEKEGSDDHAKARLARLEAMSDEQFLDTMIVQESRNPDSAAMQTLIQAYALHRSAQTGQEADAAGLRQLEVFKNNGVKIETIQAAIHFGSVDRVNTATSRIETQRAVYDRSTVKNRFLNFVGRVVDRDISPDKMGWRAIDAIAAPPGHTDAEIILSHHARGALKLRTGGSVKFGEDAGPIRIMMERANSGGIINLYSGQRYAEDMRTAINTAIFKFDDTPMGKARQAVLAERQQELGVKGATLGLRFLGVEDIFQRMADCDNAAEMSVLVKELQDVRGELADAGNTYDPVGIAHKAVKAEKKGKTKAETKTIDENEDKRKLTRKAIRGEIEGCVNDKAIKRGAKETDEDYVKRMQGNARTGLVVYERHQLHNRACAALTLKEEGRESFGQKLNHVVPESMAAMRARMTERYGGMLHEGKVSSNKIPPQVREGLIDAAEVNILRMFQEQVPPVDFKTYLERLDDADSPERQECVRVLGAAVANAKITVDGKQIQPAQGAPNEDAAVTKQRGEAFAGVLIGAFKERVEALEKDGKKIGADGYLAERSQGMARLDLAGIAQREVSSEAATATDRVIKNDSVDRLFGNVPRGRSVRVNRTEGMKLEVSGEMSGVELTGSLGLTSADEFILTQSEKGRYGVVVSGALGAKLTAGASYADTVSVEAALAVTGTRGVQFNFENQEQCRQFMGGLLAVNDLTPEQMMGRVQSISTVNAISAEASISAEVKPLEFAESVVEKATSARDAAGKLFVPEGDKAAEDGKKIIDAQLTASASIGGEHTTERISPTRKKITTKLTMQAGVEGEFSAAVTEKLSKEAKFEAHAIRQTSLEREYDGEVLTGAKSVRTFKIEALKLTGTDDQEDYRKRYERVENARTLMKEQGVVNDELLKKIADMEDSDELEFDITSEMVQSSLDKYEAETNPIRRMMMLNDRENFRASAIEMRQNVNAVAQSLSKEAEHDPDEEKEEEKNEDEPGLVEQGIDALKETAGGKAVGGVIQDLSDELSRTDAVKFAQHAGNAVGNAVNEAETFVNGTKETVEGFANGTIDKGQEAAVEAGRRMGLGGGGGSGIITQTAERVTGVVQAGEDMMKKALDKVPVKVKFSVSGENSAAATQTVTYRARDVIVGTFAMETPNARTTRLEQERLEKEAKAKAEAEAEAERLKAEAEKAEAEAKPETLEDAAAAAAAEKAAADEAAREEAANAPPYVSNVDTQILNDFLRDCDFTKQGLINHFGGVHEIASKFIEATEAQQAKMSDEQREEYKKFKTVADALKPLDEMFSPDKDQSEYDALPDDKARADMFADKLDEAVAHAQKGTPLRYRKYPEINNEDIDQWINKGRLTEQNINPDEAQKRLIGNFGAVDGIVRGFQEAVASQIKAMSPAEKEAYQKRKALVDALKPLHAVFTDEAGRSEYDGMDPEAQKNRFKEKLDAAALQAMEGARNFNKPGTRTSFRDLQDEHGAKPKARPERSTRTTAPLNERLDATPKEQQRRVGVGARR